MPNIELIHDDCMNVMAKYPDKYFELAVVDPPYGIGVGSRGAGDYSRKWTNYSRETDKKWDVDTPNEDYFIELFRVSKEQIIWGGNYMVEFLPPSMGWVCWYKTDEVKGRDFSEVELAFTSFQKAARHFEEKPFIRNGARIHPTQKPIKLYKWLLHNYAKPGDKILDTHLGSGSSAIAAHDMGFDFVGCELDKDYYDAACKRFKQNSNQTPLFSPIHKEKIIINQQPFFNL